MALSCEACGRSFGGQFAFDRHFDRRRGGCRPDGALRARGLRLNDAGVWVQARGFLRQLRLWAMKPGRPRRP